MDRLYRPTLVLTVALAAALLAREATLRQAARSESPPPDIAAVASAPSYPPRLLELPEGVVPVALNFAPPPMSPLPAQERQVAQATPELEQPLFDPPRLPDPTAAPILTPPQSAEFSPPRTEHRAMPPRSLEASEAFETDPGAANFQAPTPSSDAWSPRSDHLDLSSDPTFQTSITSTQNAPEPDLRGPQLEPPQSDRSVIKRVEPIAAESVPSLPVRTSNLPTPTPQRQDDRLAAVDGRARRMVDHALSMAQRGAVYTARAELTQTLRLIAQSLDATAGTQGHVESLAAAFRALEEGETFQTDGAHPAAAPNVPSLVRGHRTPVLKNADLARVTALEAMQQYYTYAQEQLAAAVDRRPSSSLALYGLGKLHMAIADKPGAGAAMDLPKAMVYHQAAMLADPQNHLAANELGVLLARYEQWDQAKRVFLHSLAVKPLPHTWHNLAVVHERLGESELAAQAHFESEQLARSVPQAAAGAVDVQWLSPAEFAATGERPAAGSDALPPQRLQMSQQSKPGGAEFWKPWTWF